MAPIEQIHLGSENEILDQNRFGRRYAPDPRDRDFPMERALRAMSRAELKRRRQAPMRGPTLDQGPTPRCVMFSAATALGAGPIMYGRTPETVLASVQVPITEGARIYEDLYEWAQSHDEWPGEDYDGTSVRAGQEYLRLVGRSGGYVWARSLEEAKDYISRVGSAPIILGIDWLAGMDSPKPVKGVYYVEPSGPVLGGHAICALWFDKKLKAWKLQQTWGSEYGNDGIAYLPDEWFDYLVFQANGEAASFTENPL